MNTELVKMSSLVQVVRNYGESTATRTAALNELQKEYPGYLSNLNLENINSQEAANAIGKLTDALQRKALVQAYSNVLTKASEELIAAQNSKVEDNLQLLDYIIAGFKSLGNVSLAAASLGESAAKNQATSIKELQGVVDSYSHSFSDLIQKQAEGNDFALLNPTKAAAAKKSVDELTAAIKKLPNQNEIGVETGDNLHATIQKTLDGQPLTVKPPKFDQTELDKITDQFNKTIADGLNNSFADIGQGLGNVLSGKKNPFSALFETIGEGVKELGKQLIVIAGVGQALKVALASIVVNPGLALGLGIALEVLGTAISNKGITAHADGGIFTQPTLWGNHLIGEKGPEALVPLDRLQGMGGGSQHVVVEGRIRGSDIVLVQNRQNVSNTRNYGNNFNTIH